MQDCLADNVPINQIFGLIRQYDRLPPISEKDIAEICQKYKLVSISDSNIKEKFTSDELQDDFESMYLYITFRNPKLRIEDIILDWRKEEFLNGVCNQEKDSGTIINTLKVIIFFLYKSGINLTFDIE